ncbi:MFS transporter, partial [Micromonospora aurantiaca]|nr:MFS transporter [Micromonospora aurantiaca]
QLWVTRVEPERAESALSLQVTAFQVAITLGSASGGALLDARGVQAAFLLGTGLAAAAGLLFAALRVPRG